MKFTERDLEKLGIEKIPAKVKADKSDIVHRCKYCGMPSKIKTSITRHEKNRSCGK